MSHPEICLLGANSLEAILEHECKAATSGRCLQSIPFHHFSSPLSYVENSSWNWAEGEVDRQWEQVSLEDVSVCAIFWKLLDLLENYVIFLFHSEMQNHAPACVNYMIQWISRTYFMELASIQSLWSHPQKLLSNGEYIVCRRWHDLF